MREISKLIDEFLDLAEDEDEDFKVMKLQRKINKQLHKILKEMVRKGSAEYTNKCAELFEKIIKMLEEVDTHVATSK